MATTTSNIDILAVPWLHMSSRSLSSSRPIMPFPLAAASAETTLPCDPIVLIERRPTRKLQKRPRRVLEEIELVELKESPNLGRSASISRTSFLRPTLELFRRRTTIDKSLESQPDPYATLRPLLTTAPTLPSPPALSPTTQSSVSASEERTSTGTHTEEIVTPEQSVDLQHLVVVEPKWLVVDDELGQLVIRKGSRTSAARTHGPGSAHTTYARDKGLRPRTPTSRLDALLEVESDVEFIGRLLKLVASGGITQVDVAILCAVRQLLQTEKSYNRHLRNALKTVEYALRASGQRPSVVRQATTSASAPTSVRSHSVDVALASDLANSVCTSTSSQVLSSRRTSIFQRTYSLRSDASTVPPQRRQSLLSRPRRLSLRGRPQSAATSEQRPAALLTLAEHLPRLIAASDRFLLAATSHSGDEAIALAAVVCRAFVEVECATGLEMALVGWASVVRSVIHANASAPGSQPIAPGSSSSPRSSSCSRSLSHQISPPTIAGKLTSSWSWSEIPIDRDASVRNSTLVSEEIERQQPPPRRRRSQSEKGPGQRPHDSSTAAVPQRSGDSCSSRFAGEMPRDDLEGGVNGSQERRQGSSSSTNLSVSGSSRLTMADAIIMPIQRAARYVLMTRDLQQAVLLVCKPGAENEDNHTVTPSAEAASSSAHRSKSGSMTRSTPTSSLLLPPSSSSSSQRFCGSSRPFPSPQTQSRWPPAANDEDDDDVAAQRIRDQTHLPDSRIPIDIENQDGRQYHQRNNLQKTLDVVAEAHSAARTIALACDAAAAAAAAASGTARFAAK